MKNAAKKLMEFGLCDNEKEAITMIGKMDNPFRLSPLNVVYDFVLNEIEEKFPTVREFLGVKDCAFYEIWVSEEDFPTERYLANLAKNTFKEQVKYWYATVCEEEKVRLRGVLFEILLAIK